MERGVVEYIANALWQVPLLAGGAWLFVWAVRPGPRTQYGVWLGVLGLAVLLPMHGMGAAGVVAMQARNVDVRSGVDPVVVRVVGLSQEAASGEGSLVKVKKEAVRRSWWPISLRMHSVCLAARAVDWLVGAYAAAVLFGVFRIARAMRAARLLVAGSRKTTLCEREMAYLESYGERLRATLPELRESSAIASPMIVGLVAPVLLLPEGFGQHTEEEVRAALCHELAHVKRRDYLVNLLCQVAALPVCWHPVTYGVQRRIRRTREMVCDAMAAREMQSEIGYARCLLAMARSMLGGASVVEQVEGLGLFGNNILEERVMRLMETKMVMSARAKVVRAASGATMMIAATAMAAMFHVIPTMAQQNTETVAQSVPGTLHRAPIASGVSSPDIAPIAPEAALAPIAPDAALAPVAPDAALAPIAPVAPIAPMAPFALARIAPLAPMAPFALAPIAPLAPMAPFAPAGQSVPAPAPAPAAAPASASDDSGYAAGQEGISVFSEKDAEGKPFVRVNGECRELTPEERRHLDEEMAKAQKQIAEATAKINSPEFKKQIADAQKQATEAATKLNSPEFKRQMEEAQQQALKARELINSDQFKKQMDEMQKQVAEATAKLNGPEFKKQMDDAQRQAAEASARMNSPEFKKQMADIQQKFQSGEMERQMKEAMERLKAAQESMKDSQVK